MAAGARSAKLTSSLLQAGAARLRGDPGNSSRKGNVSIDPPPVPSQKQLVLDADDWLRPRAGKYDYSEKAEVPKASHPAATPVVDPDEGPTFWLKYDGVAGVTRPPPSTDPLFDPDSDEPYSWSKYVRPAAAPQPALKEDLPPTSVLPETSAETSNAEMPAHAVSQDQAPALVPASIQEAPAEDSAPVVVSPSPGEFAVLAVDPTFSSLYAAWHREDRAVAAALSDLGRSAGPNVEAPIRLPKLSAPTLLALSHANDPVSGSHAEPAFDPLVAALAEPLEAAPGLAEAQPAVKADAEAPPEILTLAAPTLLPPAASKRGLGAPNIEPHLSDLSRLQLCLDIESEARAEMPALSIPGSLALSHAEAEAAPTYIAPSFDPLTALAELPEAETTTPETPSSAIADVAPPPEALMLAAPDPAVLAAGHTVVSTFAGWPALPELRSLSEPDAEARFELPAFTMSECFSSGEGEFALLDNEPAFDPLLAAFEQPALAETEPQQQPQSETPAREPEASPRPEATGGAQSPLATPHEPAMSVAESIPAPLAATSEQPSETLTEIVRDAAPAPEEPAELETATATAAARKAIELASPAAEDTAEPAPSSSDVKLLLAALRAPAAPAAEPVSEAQPIASDQPAESVADITPPEQPAEPEAATAASIIEASIVPTDEIDAAEQAVPSSDVQSLLDALRAPATPVAEPVPAPVPTVSEQSPEIEPEVIPARELPPETAAASLIEASFVPIDEIDASEQAVPSSDVQSLLDALRAPAAPIAEPVSESQPIASDQPAESVADIRPSPEQPAEPEAAAAAIIETATDPAPSAGVIDTAEPALLSSDLQLLLDVLRTSPTPVAEPVATPVLTASEQSPKIAPEVMAPPEQLAEPEASTATAMIEGASDPLPIVDEVPAQQLAPVSEETQLLPPASHELSSPQVEPVLGSASATIDPPTEITPTPAHFVTPEATDSASNLDAAVADPPIDTAALAAEAPAEVTASLAESDDIEADPRADHRAAVAALSKQLSSVIGSVLDSKDFAALPNLRPRAQADTKPKVSRGAPLRPPATVTEPPVSPGVVANLPQRPVSSRRSWTRMAMAASSAMMIIASGFVAFGLGGAHRASIPPEVRTEATAVPAPAQPAPPPLAAVIEPEEHAEPPPSSEPAKPSSHKLHHAKRNSP